MKAIHVVLLAGCATALIGCGDDETRADPVPEQPSWESCQGSRQSFVRRALQAVGGRHAWGLAEIRAYEQHLSSLVESGLEEPAARDAIVQSMFQEASFRTHWSEVLMDGLEVRRSEVIRTNFYVEVQAQSCYGNPSEIPIDGGELAAWVRDHTPLDISPPVANFTLGQLLNSALTLDDLTPVLRGHLFQLIAFPLPGANVEELELERLRRLDIGETFEGTYLNRNPTCMECHNQDVSVTTIYPAPGNFDRALFRGASATANPLIQYRSMFRVDGVVVEEGNRPWGWNSIKCGQFAIPSATDPLGEVVSFGSLDPNNSSVWSVEAALRRGFDLLRADHEGQKAAADPDPDAALAYLVSRTVTELVWSDIFGSELTVAHHFPRTEVQQRVLDELTDAFISSNYSLRALLLKIVAHPAFNLASPQEGCGDAASQLPPLFNPWVEPDATGQQTNSPADLVRPRGARELLRDFHRSLGWTPPSSIPQGRDLNFQRSIGVFISKSDRGFDGLDLMAQLSWEDDLVRCEQEGTDDFVDELVATVQARPEATLGDAVTALKDRILGEPIDPEEQAALEALLGAPLGGPPPGDLEAKLREVCGTFAISPQFVLGGMGVPDATELPDLASSGKTYADFCADVARRLTVAGVEPALDCGVAP